MLPLLLGATGGALLVREHDVRLQAERLSAALLETLLRAIDANDPETGGHVRRVARIALVLADAADLDGRAQCSIERIALFHDIGKIAQALFDIIHDDGKLSDADRRAIATHPQRGADVLEPLSSFYPELAEGVLSHHERWDGLGYPRKLRGDAIPIAARVVAIADTFDAIASSRRYHRGTGLTAAAAEIARGRGTQFDPDLTDLFLLPPVFERVRETLAEGALQSAAAGSESDVLRPTAGERRRRRKATKAPDVSFRWRTSALVQPPQDPQPTAPPG